MQSIAFIGSGHDGSTVPLIRQFLLKGFLVDYYLLTSGPIYDIEATDICFTPTHFGLEEIPSSCWPKLSGYFGDKEDSVRLFSIKTSRPYESRPLLNHFVSAIFRNTIIRQACHYINQQHYSFINIIGRYTVSDILRYCRYLHGNLTVSLHEVCNHETPDFVHPNWVMKNLFKKKTPIIVFSHKSYSDLIKYKGVEEKSIFQLKFGLFTSYSIYGKTELMELPKRFFLFVGRINSYKGLGLIYNAFGFLSVKVKEEISIVIAGGGHDANLERMSHISNFHIINRFLKNEEICELIQHSDAVICPYTSASQSGIPQTAFVFGRPIIASDIDGLNDVVKNDYNGILFNVGEAKQLAEIMEQTWKNPELLQRLSKDMSSFETVFHDYSWDSIVNSYITYFLL